MLALSRVGRSTAGKRGLSSLLSVTEEFPGVPATSPTPATSTSPTLTTLPNGLTIITEPNATTTTVSITYPSGSSSEQAGESGAALAAKHMAFKSSATTSSARILYDLEMSGASPFSNVSRFSSTKGFTCAKENAMGLIDVIATTSAYELWDMRDARAYSSLDLSEMMSTPETCLSDLIYGASYGEKTQAGKSMYATCSNEGIVSWMERELVGGTVVATGVEDHKAFVEATSSVFSSLTGGTPSAAPTFTGGESRLAAGTPYSHVALAFKASDNNAVNAVVKAAMDMETGDNAMGFKAEGIVGAYGSSLAGDAGSLTESIMSAIGSSISLDTAKAKAKGDVVFSMESGSAALASGLASNCGMGPSSIAAAIDKVTEADVKKVLTGKIAMAAVGDLTMVPYHRNLV